MVLHLSEQGIATVNEIAFPANTPVQFKSDLQLRNELLLHPVWVARFTRWLVCRPTCTLIANEASTYDGISASYSGPGFSGMKFKAIATPDRALSDQWVAKAKQSPNTMSDMAAFEKVAAPGEYNKGGVLL